ncbi:iron ABC transporter substrate-binding protein [Desulfonatronovibrio magnus]|uniref:iron ABC transporter substrate-binding protein n=1 Tax=Desulfonatronovibrio magnus TaxID=698827 RepID=UPI000697B2A2|nr:iron ABC transporter substrate-binding protein [Desulfonatronovibrio magnus]
MTKKSSSHLPCCSKRQNQFSFTCGLIMAMLVSAFWLFYPPPIHARASVTITDSMGREITVPAQVDRVICSGSGCLRLLTYLQAQDRIVGVDSAEKGGLPFSADARPYAIANPQFRDYPLFGEFRGHDSPELIAGLDPQPQVIFKTYASRDGGIDNLQTKTGIPVIALDYGNLTYARDDLDKTLTIMGSVLGIEERARGVIQFFNSLQADLEGRTRDIPKDQRPTVYVGGVAQRGGHGFQSTESAYAPFEFLNAQNVAGHLYSNEKRSSHASVAKEKILIWDPEIIFMDISTTRLDGIANGLEQLRQDQAYRTLSAIKKSEVYGVFPYNFYTQNFENIFANAYFIGKTIYPDQFADIDPMEKAEEISYYLNGGPAFRIINSHFENLGFSRITVNQQ